MNTVKLINDFLNEYNIKFTAHDFVEITSNVYHKFEAEKYDYSHYSIELSIPYWRKTLIELEVLLQKKDNLRMLDFGCGTGFATEQVLNSSLKDKFSKIICYDLSPDMIQICNQKFNTINSIEYLSDRSGFENLKNETGKFDVIICNSLIHHILDHKELFKVFKDSLTENGIVIIGHEPNKNFYQNKTLQRVSNIYRLYKKAMAKLGSFFTTMSITIEDSDVCKLTYDKLIEKEYITETFPKYIIQKFIDIHVPMNTLKKQPWGELGFNKDFFKISSENNLQVINQISYNHIKDQQAYKSLLWRAIAKILQKIYPNDGADAIFVLIKK